MHIAIWNLPPLCDLGEVLKRLRERYPDNLKIILNEKSPPSVGDRSLGVRVHGSPGLSQELACTYAVDEVCIELLREAHKLHQYRGFVVEHLLEKYGHTNGRGRD